MNEILKGIATGVTFVAALAAIYAVIVVLGFALEEMPL